MADDPTGMGGRNGGRRALSDRLAQIAGGPEAVPSAARLETSVRRAVADAVPIALSDAVQTAVSAALPRLLQDALARVLPAIVGDSVREALAAAPGVPGGVDARKEIDALRVDIADALEYVRESVLARFDGDLAAVHARLDDQLAVTREILSEETRTQAEAVSETVSEAVSAAVTVAVTTAVTEDVTDGVTDRVTDGVSRRLTATIADLLERRANRTEPAGAGFEAEIDALRVDLASALDFLRDTVDTVDTTAATGTEALLAALLEVRADIATLGADDVPAVVRAEVRAAIAEPLAELAIARAEVAAVGARVESAGRLLVAYLQERDAILEEVRDRGTGQLLAEVLAGLPDSERARAADRVRGWLARRREGRDAERWRARHAGAMSGDLPDGGDEVTLVELLDAQSPPGDEVTTEVSAPAPAEGRDLSHSPPAESTPDPTPGTRAASPSRPARPNPGTSPAREAAAKKSPIKNAPAKKAPAEKVSADQTAAAETPAANVPAGHPAAWTARPATKTRAERSPTRRSAAAAAAASTTSPAEASSTDSPDARRPDAPAPIRPAVDAEPRDATAPDVDDTFGTMPEATAPEATPPEAAPVEVVPPEQPAGERAAPPPILEVEPNPAARPQPG